MTNAFASRPYDPLDDEFDAELDVAPQAASPVAAGDINPREPLQFTAPGGYDPNAPVAPGGAVVAHPAGLPATQG
ncbi:MAG: hypothetical protein IOB84_10800, partial [Brevundimonas sp.]|nr:hypothetical protein [Brevundimonas sp.]